MAAHAQYRLRRSVLPACGSIFPREQQARPDLDDVTLATLFSEILPRDTQLDTQLAENLRLNIPSFRPTWTR